MKFDINSLHDNTSTKTKTIVLVLGMFFILSLFFIYLQYSTTKEFINESQHEYEKKLNSIYKESIYRIKKFYKNRGLANLNSFEIEKSLELNNKKRLFELSKKRWEILSNENNYLKTMAFYDHNKKLITYLGKKPSLNIQINKDLNFIINNKKDLNFKVSIESINKKGYLVFFIDPLFFLSEIYHLANIESYILFDNQLLFLEKFKNSSLKNHLNRNKKSLKTNFELDNKLYSTHRISLLKDNHNKKIEIIFFQDITSGQERLSFTVLKTFFLLSILGTISLIILHYGFKVLIDRLELSNSNLEKSQEELSLLNKNLEKKVEQEVALKIKKENEAKEKERILVHQSKLASMGEMIGSIAHQWRQPLTQLSSVLVLVELKYERGKLTLKELRESIHQSQEQIEFMSKTIDDFRNFFKPNKQKDFFSPYKSVQSALSLISSSFENYNIKVNLKFEDEVLINGYESEFSQVILNILSNSKDAFIEKQIANPIITVTISKEDKNSKIVLCDNAGGINLTPIEKVFEPYVTTKHASSGTGIGLYMSKNIIEKSMNGSLSVSNNKNGVCFEIIL
ncbi:histidine kinase/DNA gyrase B/HSP90-like ATPase [Malaciobacter marinus]|uniref:histidine kinase n=1 Tax=Malaciobacter marinus TaxID=505249 RepID=A0AB36ZY53_9BACT|nr:HAMP domain-containing sensor histidine kinase [Malaciobacter marinus]PPK62414.1 histidine kinase/DNA gyrase B/HSP90-like ATPase [Malaciobacter marinus]SKB25210.1 Histidine kinase-, DNA gyrase B-, and HSP90-like ATPase [Malaciobacter marinus]